MHHRLICGWKQVVPQKSSSDLKNCQINKETFCIFVGCERKQLHLPRDEYSNKEKYNTHWYVQTAEGMWINVLENMLVHQSLPQQRNILEVREDAENPSDKKGDLFHLVAANYCSI